MHCYCLRCKSGISALLMVFIRLWENNFVVFKLCKQKIQFLCCRKYIYSSMRAVTNIYRRIYSTKVQVSHVICFCFIFSDGTNSVFKDKLFMKCYQQSFQVRPLLFVNLCFRKLTRASLLDQLKSLWGLKKRDKLRHSQLRQGLSSSYDA